MVAETEGIPGSKSNQYRAVHDDDVATTLTVNACQTIWRFMNSYDTSRWKCRRAEINRRRSNLSASVRYLACDSVDMRARGEGWTHRPFHRNTTKLTSAARPCIDSSRVSSSHALRRRSDEGASGQAFDRAWERTRLCKYGTNIVKTLWINRVE